MPSLLQFDAVWGIVLFEARSASFYSILSKDVVDDLRAPQSVRQVMDIPYVF